MCKIKTTHRLSEQMSLDGDHDAEEVPGGDESRSLWVLGPERDVCVLLVEVVQELRELCVRHVAVLLAPEVQLAEVGVEREGEALVQRRLLDDLAELICKMKKVFC